MIAYGNRFDNFHRNIYNLMIIVRNKIKKRKQQSKQCKIEKFSCKGNVQPRKPSMDNFMSLYKIHDRDREENKLDARKV